MILSDLEIKTLRRLALGMDAKMIAKQDRVKPAAVYCRVYRACRKLNVLTTEGAVMLAYQMGLYKLPRIGAHGWVSRSGTS